jgi:hypothetical protein
MYTHTHTRLFNVPEYFITAPNTAALWHRKPVSARTSCDSCGAQHSDKRRHILCIRYTHENFVEFPYNIAESF